MLARLRALIEDGKASKRETSRKALEQLLQLSKADRVHVTREDLDEMTADDQKRFFESLVGVENVKIGFTFKEMMTAMGVVAFISAFVVGLGLTAMNVGKVRLSGTDQAVLTFARDANLVQRIEQVGAQNIAARLTLSQPAVDLAAEFSQVEERMSRVAALSRTLRNDDWVDVARFLAEAGEPGVAFVRFVTNLDFADGTNNFITRLFRRVPAFDSGQAVPDWSGAVQRLIAALATARDAELFFTSEAHDRVAVLAALERLDRRRRDAILAVMGASEADMALIADRGLPLPLQGEQRLAYDTILSFDDPARQVTLCLKGAERSDDDWLAMDWSLTSDGRTGKLIMDASTHLSPDRPFPRPCLDVLMPNTPEWSRAGAWSRTIDGRRVGIPICIMEMPRSLLPQELRSQR